MAKKIQAVVDTVEYYRRQPGVICAEDVNITKAHDNDLCIELLNVARKQNMVHYQVKRFKNNALLAQTFSVEEVQGILNRTICEVLSKFRDFVSDQKKANSKKKSKAKKVVRATSRKNKSTTDLSTFGLLKGYFINAFINNVKKEYTRQMTQKRSHATSFVSLNPSPLAEDKTHSKSANILESMIADSSGMNAKDRQDILHELILFFRAEDAKANQQINDPKKRSKLARLFVALINPRSKGDQKNIIEKINITDHYFKEGRKKIIEKIQKQHADISREWLNLVIERDCDETQDPKKNKPQFEKPAVFELIKFNRMNAVEEEDKNKKKVSRYFTHSLFIGIKKISGDGSTEMIKEKEIQIVDKKNQFSFDQAKKMLEEKGSKAYESMVKDMRKMRGY